jgi:hypothetical protein
MVNKNPVKKFYIKNLVKIMVNKNPVKKLYIL